MENQSMSAAIKKASLNRYQSLNQQPNDENDITIEDITDQAVNDPSLLDIPSRTSSRRSQRAISTYHCHARASAPTVDGNAKARRTLMIVTVICILFMIAEIVGGWIANSLAVITDAAHLLTDIAGFMISLFALYLANLRATPGMSFGWHRAEVMGALVSVLSIWVITAILVFLAIQRVIDDNYEIDALVMLLTAGLGIMVNIIMGLVLHFCGGGHGHTHGGMSHAHSHGDHNEHGHSHSSKSSSQISLIEDLDRIIPSSPARLVSVSSPHKTKVNINVRAAFIHVIGDFCQSVGVFIAALVIYIVGPSAKIADPICTFLFSILVLFTTITVLRDIVAVLMEATPRGIKFEEVFQNLAKVKGVVRVHNLRIWALTLDKVAISAHLAISSTGDAQNVLYDASVMLEKKFGVFESTIQIELYTDKDDDCDKCDTTPPASSK